MSVTVTADAAKGLSNMVALFNELPKTQVVGITAIVALGAIVAIDLVTSREYNIDFDWSNRKVVLTKASVS